MLGQRAGKRAGLYFMKLMRPKYQKGSSAENAPFANLC